MKDNRPIQECLEPALDLLAAWIRSSSFPAPQINRVITFSEGGDQVIRFEVPQLILSQDELEIFSGRISHSPLGERAVLIRGNLSAIAGRLTVSSSKKSGTVFEIFVPSVDPIKEFVLADTICRKLLSLDFTLKEFFQIWKWTRAMTKKTKQKKPTIATIADEPCQLISRSL